MTFQEKENMVFGKLQIDPLFIKFTFQQELFCLKGAKIISDVTYDKLMLLLNNCKNTSIVNFQLYDFDKNNANYVLLINLLYRLIPFSYSKLR